MKHFQRAYLRPFPGLNVLTRIWLTFNLIQNYISPPQSKFSGSTPVLRQLNENVK